MKVTLEKIEAALDRAFEKACERSRRTGVPMVFYREGHVVEEMPQSTKKPLRYTDSLTDPSLSVREEHDSGGEG